jgi:hemerythrin
LTDKSEKIILAHTAHTLTKDEEKIGCGVTFGSTDILIEGHEDYALQAGGNYLRGYYPNAEESEIHMLLNCKREPVSAGTILLKDQEKPEHVILVLTGVAELLSTNDKTHFQLSSGTLIGDLPVLFGLKSTGTFRALTYVEILKIPAVLFKEFVNRHRLLGQIKKTQNTIGFLRQTWLFGESISTPVQSQIAQKMKLRKYEKGASITCEGLMLVKDGKVELSDSGTEMQNSRNEVVEKGDFWGCEQMILNKALNSNAIALASSFIYSIAETEILEQIPIVRWKLLEQAHKRA